MLCCQPFRVSVKKRSFYFIKLINNTFVTYFRINRFCRTLAKIYLKIVNIYLDVDKEYWHWIIRPYTSAYDC